MNIHPTAVIEAGAKLADDVVVGPHAVIYRHVTLGPGCVVHAGAVLGDTPQDMAFGGEDSFVVIGAGCVIREHVTIHRGTKPGTTTEVGDGCFLMAGSHLAHNVKLGRKVIVANGAMLGGYAEVGDQAFLSGNAMAHQFVRIGRLAMLGGGVGVSRDVPPFCILRSNSLNRVTALNVVGMRRAGFSAEVRLEIQRAFRVLYRSGLNVPQALARLQAEFPSGPGREMHDFVAASRRGICAGTRGGDVAED